MRMVGSGIARNADCYQLLAYATATNVEVGILSHCQADESHMKTITIAHGGQRLTCHPLPLAGDWGQVSHEVDRPPATIRALAEQYDPRLQPSESRRQRQSQRQSWDS